MQNLTRRIKKIYTRGYVEEHDDFCYNQEIASIETGKPLEIKGISFQCTFTDKWAGQGFRRLNQFPTNHIYVLEKIRVKC